MPGAFKKTGDSFKLTFRKVSNHLKALLWFMFSKIIGVDTQHIKEKISGKKFLAPRKSTRRW